MSANSSSYGTAHSYDSVQHENQMPDEVAMFTFLLPDSKQERSKIPEIRLILAIFKQCLYDIEHCPNAHTQMIRRYRVDSLYHNSAEAQLFFDERNPAFQDYCRSLGIKSEIFLNKYHEWFYKLKRGIACAA